MLINLMFLRFSPLKLSHLYVWLLPQPSHNAIFRVPELKIGFGYPRQLPGTRLPELPDPALLLYDGPRGADFMNEAKKL